jgi:hypothetical protein
MFDYDGEIQTAVENPPASIDDALKTMEAIDALCQNTDGLKWFNGLYLQVTQAIKKAADAGQFRSGAWLTALDVNFAALYFGALKAELGGGDCPKCWSSMFHKRGQARTARIQFALAGMNAHIRHDLAMAIVSTCQAANIVPQHGTQQYADYTAVNTILDGIIGGAKKELNVDPFGNALPGVSDVEDAVAGWDLANFREKAWDKAETLWTETAADQARTMELEDLLVAGENELLLIPAP